MYGRRESGKTYFVTGMLFQQEKFIKDPFTKVIWINKSFQKDMYEKLMHANQFELEFNPILNGGGIFTPPNELSQISEKLRRPKACAFLYVTKN